MDASFFITGPDGIAECRLCAQYCRLAPGMRGKCGVRMNSGGRPVSLVTEGPAALAVDPVEKKPLHHFRPGAKVFSMGTMGCNFDCAWCQNDTLSRGITEGGELRFRKLDPADAAVLAVRNNCSCVAYTYNEPTVFFEYMRACALAAHALGLKNILVSNGCQSPESLREIIGFTDAANIDLKTFRAPALRRLCAAPLRPVLDNLKTLAASSVWLEVTTLVIPGINDSNEELRDIARFIRTELGAFVPWHVSAFRPCRNMMSVPPTPPGTVMHAAEIGKEEGLDFVYPGNITGRHATSCPGCGKELIVRSGFSSRAIPGFSGTCPECGRVIPGIWK